MIQIFIHTATFIGGLLMSGGGCYLLCRALDFFADRIARCLGMQRELIAFITLRLIHRRHKGPSPEQLVVRLQRQIAEMETEATDRYNLAIKACDLLHEVLKAIDHYGPDANVTVHRFAHNSRAVVAAWAFLNTTTGAKRA